MGNEESTMMDDSIAPSVLEARNIEAVAKYIKDHNVKKIVLMVC
jgi:NAD-dependent histone deacetylase SIR2